MTSKRFSIKSLFLTLLLEDLRHKIWLLALSCIGSFCAFPLAFMIFVDDRYGRQFLNYFQEDIYASGGIVGIVGAFLVGLLSFRFLYHRQMVDTYHAIPVKRKTLFWVNYINGLLIYLIPAIFFLLSTIILEVTRYDNIEFYNSGERFTRGYMVSQTLVAFGALVVAFLLVYHITLLGCMLAGNVLNAIVTTGILGCGIGAFVFVIESYKECYFNTYLNPSYNLENISQWLYGSPLIESIYLLVNAANKELTIGMCSIQLIIIAILLGIAYLLYQKRPSELAGGGIYYQKMIFVMRAFMTLLCALAGFIFFGSIGSVNMNSLETYELSYYLWGVFGALFVGFLISGILSIVFRMDFKAFFKGTCMTLGGIVLSCVLAVSLMHDWYGYDTYLPKKEDVKEISLYCSNLISFGANDYSVRSELEDETYKVTDIERIYPYLEKAVELQGTSLSQENYIYGYLQVKVTRKNGGVYYRNYSYNEELAGYIRDMLLTEEIKSATYFPQDKLYDISSIRFINDFGTNEDAYYKDTHTNFEAVSRQLIEAINQDIKASYPDMIDCKNRIYGYIRIHYTNGIYKFPVYESAVNTRALLEELGHTYLANGIEAKELKKIQISMNYSYEQLESYAQNYNLTMKEALYHMYQDCFMSEGGLLGGFNSIDGYAIAEGYATAEVYTIEDEKYIYGDIAFSPYESLYVEITDPQEIQELLQDLSYGYVYNWTSRREQWFAVMLSTENIEGSGYLRMDSLGEQYFDKFCDKYVRE